MLTQEEATAIRSQSVTLIPPEPNRSQIVTGSQKRRDPCLSPFAFTEHGALMAANVLHKQAQ
jgi:hypothetical protein